MRVSCSVTDSPVAPAAPTTAPPYWCTSGTNKAAHATGHRTAHANNTAHARHVEQRPSPFTPALPPCLRRCTLLEPPRAQGVCWIRLPCAGQYCSLSTKQVTDVIWCMCIHHRHCTVSKCAVARCRVTNKRAAPCLRTCGFSGAHDVGCRTSGD